MTTLEICGNGHKLSVYCSNCNRFFCGECCTFTHIRNGGFKDHDVEPIRDRLIIEGQKREHLIQELKQFSANEEGAAIIKNEAIGIGYESRESLSRFIAEVERFLLSAQQSRQERCLQLRRECIALLQQVASVRRCVNEEAHPEYALVSLRTLNLTLEKQFEEVKKWTAGGQELDFTEALYSAVVAHKGQPALEGKIELTCLLKFFY